MSSSVSICSSPDDLALRESSRLLGAPRQENSVLIYAGLIPALTPLIVLGATGVTRPLNCLDTSLKSEKDLGSPQASTVSTTICKISTEIMAPGMTALCTTGNGAVSMLTSRCGNFRRHGNVFLMQWKSHLSDNSGLAAVIKNCEPRVRIVLSL